MTGSDLIVHALVVTLFIQILLKTDAACVNDVLYDFTPISTMANNISSFSISQSLCPDKPLYGSFRAQVITGEPHVLDPDSFDAESDEYKLSYIRQEIKTPYMVDIDSMTDAEIESSCVTVADCRMPPMLTVIRKASDGSIWRPSIDTGSSKYSDLENAWCCNTNEALDGFDYTFRNSNTKTILQLFPAARHQFRSLATFRSLTLFPSTATTPEEAKIIRVDFSVGSTQLYTYVDYTCNEVKGYTWLNGFTGHQGRTGGGLFHEVILQSKNRNLPSIHGPARQDLGPRPINTTYMYIQYIGNFKTGSNKVLQWAAAKNFWYTPPKPAKNKEGYLQMASAHLKTATEWLFLAPPKGNLPVAFMYLFASYLFLDAAGVDFTPDFYDDSLLNIYQGDQYTFMKPVVEYLLETVSGSTKARIFHALLDLDGLDNCRGAFLTSFYNQFAARSITTRKPPEQGCIGANPSSAKQNCQLWHSRRCENTINTLYEARALKWADFHDTIPKCSECPGLIGWWRSGAVISDHQKLLDVGKHPQCFPWRDYDGTKQSDLGYDMDSSDAYELDYNEGYTCDANSCRFTDADQVSLSKVVKAFSYRTCQDRNHYLRKKRVASADACRKLCFDPSELKCMAFKYNTNRKYCFLYEECSTIGKNGKYKAKKREVMYLPKPKVYNHTASWSDAVIYTDITT